MPVRATAVIRILSTTAGVVTFLVLRKMLSLPASRVIRDDVDVCTVYINLIAPGQPLTRTDRPASRSELTGRGVATSVRTVGSCFRFALVTVTVGTEHGNTILSSC